MLLMRDAHLRSLLCSVSALMSCCTAIAHTPYLLPSTFAVTKDHASFQSAMTEDIYFSPEFPVRATSYAITGPNGQTSPVDTVTMTKDMAIVDVPIPADGTYRVSTGAFVARTMKMANIDGRWLMVRSGGDRRGPAAPSRDGDGAMTPGSQGQPPSNAASNAARAAGRREGPPRFVEEAAVPAAAETLNVQNILKSETYVTKGAPTDAALQVSGEGFELKPLDHPNEIYLDKGFKFQILLDGKPQKDLHVSIYRGGNIYDDRKIVAQTSTDANGTVSLKFDKPGVYLLSSNYPQGRSDGAAPVTKRYSYSLTFEVLQ